MNDRSVRRLIRLDNQHWDAELASCGQSFRFSHRSAAGQAFEAAYESYSYEPYRVEYHDGTSLLAPLVRVRRRLSSLSMMLGMPLGLEGTPLAVAGSLTASHVDELYRALDGVGMLAIHGGAAGSPPSRPGIASPGSTHVLDLHAGFESLWTDTFTSRNRNSCRKADRAGVRVAEEHGDEAVAAYWSLYETASGERGHARPPYPRTLFSALLDSGHAELWLARLDGRVLAGGVMLQGSDDLLYWSGAMDRRHQSVAPSNAVLRRAIRSACARDIDYFDFGASSGNAGVERFKQSFGPTTRAYDSVELSSPSYRVDARWRRRRATRTAAP